MAKTSKTRAKPNGKAERKTKAKAEKPSLEKLSDQERQKLLLRHKNKIKPALAQLKEAQDDLRTLYETAKNDGIPKKEIELAISFETSEGIEKRKKEAEAVARVARWCGVGEQMDLFGKGDKLSRHERLFEDGRIAALNDQKCRPPDHLPQKDADVWMEGHAAGRTALNTERASGFKAPDGQLTLGEAAKEVVDNLIPPTANGDAATVGATH